MAETCRVRTYNIPWEFIIYLGPICWGREVAARGGKRFWKFSGWKWHRSTGMSKNSELGNPSLGGGNSNLVYFHHYLEKGSNLTFICFKSVGPTTNQIIFRWTSRYSKLWDIMTPDELSGWWGWWLGSGSDVHVCIFFQMMVGNSSCIFCCLVFALHMSMYIQFIYTYIAAWFLKKQ